MSSGDQDAMDLGETIVIGGLVVQVIVFGLFIVTAGVFHIRMRARPTNVVLVQQLKWQLYLAVLYVVSLLIMVRSVFRLIEYAEGNDGYLMSNEVWLYLFDSLLMFAAMAIMAWYHPSEINALLKKDRGMKAMKNLVKVYTPL